MYWGCGFVCVSHFVGVKLCLHNLPHCVRVTDKNQINALTWKMQTRFALHISSLEILSKRKSMEIKHKIFIRQSHESGLSAQCSTRRRHTFFVNAASRAHTSNHACNKQHVLLFLSVATQFDTRKSHLNLLVLAFSFIPYRTVVVSLLILCKYQKNLYLRWYLWISRFFEQCNNKFGITNFG